MKWWWIKERHNTQLGVYYVAMGEMPIKEAMRHTKAIYGDNFMHPYTTQSEYEKRLDDLRAIGAVVQVQV